MLLKPLPLPNCLVCIIRTHLHTLNPILVTNSRKCLTSLLKHLHDFNFFYLHKIQLCLRLTFFSLAALMWLYVLNTTTQLTAAAPHIRLTQSNNHANISELLDNLLRGYDNSIRPGFGGECQQVN